jgi:hypothetical protein
VFSHGTVYSVAAGAKKAELLGRLKDLTHQILTWTGEKEYHLFGGFADGELIGVTGVVI